MRQVRACGRASVQLHVGMIMSNVHYSSRETRYQLGFLDYVLCLLVLIPSGKETMTRLLELSDAKVGLIYCVLSDALGIFSQPHCSEFTSDGT